MLTEEYTLDDLRSYIKTKLGGLLWRLEGMSLDKMDVIDQSIGDAVMAYSRRCPILSFETFPIIPSKQIYPIKCPGFGVFAVDFVYPAPVVAPFMHSLIGVTPITNLMGGDFDLFLTWQKSFQRVTSTAPLWMWDSDNKNLMIYNPQSQAKACAFMYRPRSFDKIKLVHKDFVKRYALAKAKDQLAQHRLKFPNIPGPAGKEIQLNGTQLLDTSKAELEKLDDELFRMQTIPVPRWD